MRHLLTAGLAMAAGVAMALPLPTSPGPPQAAATRLDVRSTPVLPAVVHDSRGGQRGPVAAVLPDGRVLLGGGANGRQLLVVDPDAGEVQRVGSLIRARHRLDDARYAPTDIEVMSTTARRARLYVSFPQYLPARGCVRVAVNRVVISLGDRPRVLRSSAVMRTRPCVRPNAIQHAAGRLVRIDSDRAYLTVGDLGFPGIIDRSRRGMLGSVLRIGRKVPTTQISQGHRNGQGLVLDSRGTLWETEHGPRGGDELNVIRRGRDYGWPFVTQGQPYGSTDYVIPRRTGTHAGYARPRTAWVPSVATSEIVQVPASWAGWTSEVGGDLLMGTLKDQSLWRIRVSSTNRVLQRERMPIGHRIRDLDVSPQGSVVATTDDGTLLTLTPR